MSRYIQNLLDVNYSIAITYLPNGQTVSFSAFLEDFSDTFKQEWTSEDVYGRMDSILSYKNTKRSIQLSFFVPSESSMDAQANFIKLGKLIKFCYPVYEKSKQFTTQEDVVAKLTSPSISSGNAMLLSSPPLIGVKFANILTSPGAGGKLICKLEEVKYIIQKDSTFYSTNNNLFTNVFKITLNMMVLHSSALGWEKDATDKAVIRDSNFKFPYNF